MSYPRLAITGVTGKIGSRVVNAILEHQLVPPSHVVVSTSSSASDARWQPLRDRGVQIREASFDDKDAMQRAFTGCDRLLLISSPRIYMDFNNAPYGTGRERDHFNAILAARAAGVKHIFYTSLAFGSMSKAGVMRAHNRTEDFLKMMSDTDYTIIREGIYSESWPLYFGHFAAPGDDRREIVVAGDGPINWTSIDDLALATALTVVAPAGGNAGITITLCQRARCSLVDVAAHVSRITGKAHTLKLVTPQQHIDYYVEERGMSRSFVEWWVTTYEALRENEGLHHTVALEDLLASKGRKAKSFQDTIREMLTSHS